MFIKYSNELWLIFGWVSVSRTDQIQAYQFGKDISIVGMGQGLYPVQTISTQWIQGFQNKR